MSTDRVVFLDKDGTLIDNIPFNVDPALIKLTEGAGKGLALLQEHGYRFVVVSNQAGVAWGRFEESALIAVEWRMRQLLEDFGVALLDFVYCPHHPDAIVEAYRRECSCRKPRPGMIVDAAARHGLELDRSWLIGDILDDVEAGRRAGCRTVLIDNGNETEWLLSEMRQPDFRASNLAVAARIIVAADRLLLQSRNHRNWSAASEYLCGGGQ